MATVPRDAGPRGDPDGAEFSLADDELLYTFPPDNDLSCVAEGYRETVDIGKNLNVMRN